ncbi:RNA recognition motif domain-containing protein, partial [Helicobacter japonicus]
ESGKPKGFGFVEIDDEGALKAIDALNEKDFRGRNLRVNEARPRE